MENLQTNYLGLKLKNPVIVGANNLLNEEDNVKKMEKAGAAAIVYRSLFEEQIQLERYELEKDLELYNERHAEMTTLFPGIEHAGPKEHLNNLRKIKDLVSIPVIASLNAVYEPSWVDYAKELESTGVDALELNFYSNPKALKDKCDEIVKGKIKIIKEVKRAVKIPVSVKLSPFYTNTLHIISEMDKTEVDGFVLFNRLFQPEIDIEKEDLHFPWNLSMPGDHRMSLRYIGLLYKEINASLCANTGILNGDHAIQMLLAGADTFQVVSMLYKDGIDSIAKLLDEIQQWMKKKNYKSLEDFKGSLSKKQIKGDPYAYKRFQYVDILWRSSEIFKKYPLP